MAQQLASIRGSRPSPVVAPAALALAALASLFAPSPGRAQGAPSNAAESGGAFAGAPSPRAGEAPSERAWRGGVRAFVEYDSNVGLTEEQAPAPYDYQGAFRTGLAASGSLRLWGDDAFALGVGGFASQSLTAGDDYADEYALSTLSPQAWASAAFSLGDRPASAQLAYQYRRDWLTGDDFERSHSVRAAASVRASESLEIAARWSLAFEDFDATGFHALDARRDADHQRLGLTATWQRADSPHSLAIGWEWLDNQAEQRDFDFSGHAATARFVTRVPAAWFVGLELFGAYSSVDYDHYTTTPRREARTQLYRVRAWVPLSRHWVVDAGVSHLRIGADQARFRSKRTAITAGAAYLF